MNKYSNTIVYKICCKDKSIIEVYIGHTINLESRKQDHIRTNSKQFIIENGGWDNWEFIVLGVYNCKSRGHAARLEWYWWTQYDKTLNQVRPGIFYIERDMKKHSNIYEYISQLEVISKLSGEPYASRRFTISNIVESQNGAHQSEWEPMSDLCQQTMPK